MNKILNIIFISLIMMVLGCSDDKASNTQPTPAPKVETAAVAEPVMEEEPAMEVPPWASLEQEVIYNSDE